MNHGKFLSILIAVSLVVSALCFSISAYATNGQAAFEGPFFYTGMTTTTYNYFSEAANGAAKSGTVNTKTITESVTVTEEQILTYYLHIPTNYDTSKKYPVVVYCSGDGITLYIDDDGGFGSSTIVNASDYSDSSPFKEFLSSYLYTEGHSNNLHNQTWGGNDLLNADGTVKSHSSAWLPHYCANSGNCDDQFVEEWVKLISDESTRDTYDCFFIFIQPTDRSWYSNSSNTKMATIRSLTIDTGIYTEYEDSIQYNNNSEAGSTYIVNELSANTNEQLVVQLIDSLASQYSIDLSRQYLAGFSLGAMFSYDMACHYPDRFACVMTSGLPTCDLTDENCQAISGTRFWFFHGNGDYCDANAVWSSQAAAKINAAGGTAYYSVMSGGHSGKYLAGQSTAVSGQAISSSTSTYEFMFKSVRNSAPEAEGKSNKEGVENLTVSAKASATVNSDGSYNLILISGAPLGDYSEHGFVITTGEDKAKAYEKTKTVAINGMVKSVRVVLESETLILSATDYGSAYLYTYNITNIPASVTEFVVKAYAVSSTGTYYSDAVDITVTITDSAISAEVK